MSVEAIVDAAATKAATVSGIKAAYGTGAVSGSGFPSQVSDGPIAVVVWTGTDVVIPMSYEQLEHSLVVYVYVAGVDPGYAYKTLIPYIARFITAWRTDRDLGGACAESWVSGADPIESVDINGRPYDRLPIRVTVREVTFGAVTSV